MRQRCPPHGAHADDERGVGRGIVFFSSSSSKKGAQLRENPHACAVFHWRSLRQQVVFEGSVTTLPEGDSDAYWRTRPREAQLAAWASDQSQPLADRDTLLADVSAVRERFRDAIVPRPDYWLGYLLVPHRIEFWHAGWHRLNERISYELGADGWTRQLLYP